MCDGNKPDIIPPIFKWAESLSSNLKRLQNEIQDDTEKLEQFHIQHPKENSSLSQNMSKKTLISPKSIKSITTPISSTSSKSAKTTLLSPLKTHNTTFKSPLSARSIQLGNTKNIQNTTIISFESNPNQSENDNNNNNNNKEHKMFNDLPQRIHNTALKVTTDGEKIITDVAKKIWGKNIPKTFLTALDIEIPINDKDEKDEESDEYRSIYATYRSRSRQSTSRPKRRSIILPALEVTKEIIPNNLIENNLGIPSKTDPDIIIPQIIERTQFENNIQKNTFTKCVMSNYSLDIISDGFWWFLINEWKMDKDINNNEKK
eukprot:235582_1